MDNCPCNICPGDICPYQQYLRCYWPDFDPILKVYSWDRFEHNPTVIMTFVQATLSWYHLSTLVIYQLLLSQFDQAFRTQFLQALIFYIKNFLDKNFVWPLLFWTLIFFDPTEEKQFGPKIFLTQDFVDPKLIWTSIFWTQMVHKV